MPPPYHAVDVEIDEQRRSEPGSGRDDRDALIKQMTGGVGAGTRARNQSKTTYLAAWTCFPGTARVRATGSARLDMAGRMLEASTAGYRGHTLDTRRTLWAVLEDPDAEGDLRAAAARVLRHSQKPETRPADRRCRRGGA